MQAMRETIYKVMESSIMAKDSDTQTDFARIMARVSEKSSWRKHFREKPLI